MLQGKSPLEVYHHYSVPTILQAVMRIYGHENEMYKEPMNLKRGKGVYIRELRECGGRTEDKTKCAKG